MQAFVKTGSSPEFALWNVTDLGYLAYATAVQLVTGAIKGNSGETYTVAKVNSGAPYTIGADSVVVLGPRLSSTRTTSISTSRRSASSRRS